MPIGINESSGIETKILNYVRLKQDFKTKQDQKSQTFCQVGDLASFELVHSVTKNFGYQAKSEIQSTALPDRHGFTNYMKHSALLGHIQKIYL